MGRIIWISVVALVACTPKPSNPPELVKAEPCLDSSSVKAVVSNTKYFDSLVVLSAQHKPLATLIQSLDPKLVDKGAFTTLQSLLVESPQPAAQPNNANLWRTEAVTSMDEGLLEKADSIFTHNSASAFLYTDLWLWIQLKIKLQDYDAAEALLPSQSQWNQWTTDRQKIDEALQQISNSENVELDRVMLRLQNEFRMGYAWKQSKTTWEYLKSLSQDEKIDTLKTKFITRDRGRAKAMVDTLKSHMAAGVAKETLTQEWEQLQSKYPDFSFEFGYSYLRETIQTSQAQSSQDQAILLQLFSESKWLSFLEKSRHTLGVESYRKEAGENYCDDQRQKASVKVAQARISNGMAAKPARIAEAKALLLKCITVYPLYSKKAAIDRNIESLGRIGSK